jgi:hypothetical protein
MPRDAGPETDWVAVAAKAQAFLCLHHAGLRDKGLVDQATFLMNLGMSRADAASLLGTSDDSIRVMLGRVRSRSAPKSAVSEASDGDG